MNRQTAHPCESFFDEMIENCASSGHFIDFLLLSKFRPTWTLDIFWRFPVFSRTQLSPAVSWVGARRRAFCPLSWFGRRCAAHGPLPSRTFSIPPPAYRARECRQWIIAVREKRQVERVCQSDSRPSIFSYPNAKYITALQFLVSDDYKISSLVWKNPLVRHQQVPSTLWRVARLVRTRWHDPSSVKKEIFGPRTTESKLLFL
jgi:hypothetical protein